MLKHRIIPALLLHREGLVKTIRFKKPIYVGDPINAIRIFNEKEVDELMVLDITATKERREPDFGLIEQFAGECFMPLTYGGGIKTLEQAGRIFALGVEKICIQSKALEDPSFITKLADRFGSSSIIVSIDIKKNWFNNAKSINSAHISTKSRHWLDCLQGLVNAGAGEVLLNAVYKDGTLSGPDLELISEATNALDVPLIAIGGISSLKDMKDAITAGASAVAAGSYFVFHGPHRAVLITYPKYNELEDYLAK